MMVTTEGRTLDTTAGTDRVFSGTGGDGEAQALLVRLRGLRRIMQIRTQNRPGRKNIQYPLVWMPIFSHIFGK
jgi:hypothetical protein